jgi:hypothetical protein
MRLFITIAAVLALTQIKAQTLLVDSTEKFLLGKEYDLWRAQSDSQRVCLLTEKAFIYREQKKYNLAIKEIERGVTYVNDTSIVSIQWKYEALINYFLLNKFDKANTVLEKFSDSQAKDIHKQKEYFYLRWSVFTETNQLEKCRNEMISLCDSLRDTVLTNEIKQLPVECKQKNQKKARTMSAFLPGLGSVYAGYPLKGATSFVTDAGLLGLTVFLAVNQLYVTAFVSGLMPFAKFYTGNVKLSNHLAYNKTAQNGLELRKAYYQKIAAIILKIEK